MATQKYIVFADEAGTLVVHLAGFSAQKRVPAEDVHRHRDAPLGVGTALWCDDDTHWHDAPPERRGVI